MGKKFRKKVLDPFNIIRPVVKTLSGADAQKQQIKAIEQQNAQIIAEQQRLAQQQATPAPASDPAQQVQQQVQAVQANAIRREKRRARVRTNLAGATNLNMSGQ